MNCNMGFPQKNWLGFPKGWQNLGKVSEFTSVENGLSIENKLVCANCKDRIYIGREEDKVFHFCNKCLQKVTK